MWSVAFWCSAFISSVTVFFFNDTATTEIYTLSLHDALPICGPGARAGPRPSGCRRTIGGSGGLPRHRSCKPPHLRPTTPGSDRKSTRLNSSHANISYAVFCLKKKKKEHNTQMNRRKDRLMAQ